MHAYLSGSGGVGLERSRDEGGSDWLRSTAILPGVEMFEAWFRRSAYRRHRHDTYAIGVTETGVQAFAYRISTRMFTARYGITPGRYRTLRSRGG